MKTPTLNRESFRALGRALRHLPSLRGSHIGARMREMVILHVSSINGCPVCSGMHAWIGHLVGLNDDDIADARACAPPEDLDAHTQLALEYAEMRTRAADAASRDGTDGDAGVDPDLVARFESMFDADAQREIRAATDLFTFMNRLNNSWEAMVPGARRRRARMGLCTQELR